MSKGTVVSDGVKFGPTKSGKIYISLNYHRSNTGRKGKSLWNSDIARKLEFEIFREADKENWRDGDGHYWGLRDQGLTELGTEEQRICKFPHTSNIQDPWHGYPVGRSKDTPSDDFIEQWIKSGVINKTIGKNIEKGKL